MKKYFTLLLLVLFFAGCREEEEQKPASPSVRLKKSVIDTKYKNTVGSQQSAASSQQTKEVRLSKSRRKLTIGMERPPTADHRLPTIDTSLIQKLIRLQSTEPEIDLREPVSREYLFSGIENPDFESMILLSHDRSVKINFDNDIFDNTDRYYTNGIRFDFISPVLRQSPLSYLMVPYWGKGMNYYGVSICQNMYTPYTTKVGGIHEGDRPYAAYLFIGGFKISNDRGWKFRQTTEIDLGVIGPSSYGDFVQKSFHNSVPTNNEPLGWENQIQNDLVLNYNLSFEKGIVSSRSMELNLNATSALGTLYTNIAGGFQFRAGVMNPYFASYGYSRMMVKKVKGYSKFQAFGFITSDVKLVGYDATLQGGMFNKSSVYTLSGSDLYPLVYQGTLGFTLSYAGIRLDFEQYLLSPEFHGCAWHKWMHIGVTFGI
ncbi:MAG: lipid A deacylase LpxR family protein [Bacteroidetes bacterium]|nr:lipid A deacylase LpxR family protein [Bacteroidota bacterium]